MARNLFGGSAADVAEDVDGSRVPGATGTVWDGPGAEAVRLTDLLDYTGNPTDTLTSNTQGMIDHFYGPDNVGLLYVDFGAGRVALTPVNTSTALAQHLNTSDPHGSKAGAIEEVNAQKGAPGGIATLDPTGKVPSSQLPALSGDSSGGSHWLNVKNVPYGAKGDGVTDDTTAILAAIDDAVYGDVIYFPPGVYVVSQPIDLYKRGITLRGSHSNLMVGPGMVGDEWACYLQAAPTFTTGAMITITGDDDGDHPAINGEHRIESLMLDGSKVPTGSLDGIFARGNVQNVVLRDVCVRQMPNNGIITASNSGDEWPYSWRLHSVMVDNCHTNGIVMERNTDLTLEDCQVIGSWSTGFKLTNCANTIITHSRAEWNGNYGFHIYGGWGNWPGSGSMTMTGCSTDRNGWDGVRIDASGNGPFLINALNTRRDGRNGGPGGGGYAGLRLSGTAPVVVTNLGCYVGTDDGGTAGTSPDYGVRITGARDVSLDSAYLHGALEGLYTSEGNGRVHLGSGITTVKGNNFSEDRVSGKAYTVGSPSAYSANGIYIPAGWGSKWKAKRDAAKTGGKAKIACVGDSLTWGYWASDLLNKNWVGLVRNSLQTAYGDGGSGYFSSNRSAQVIGAGREAYIAALQANGSAITTTGTWTETGLYYGPAMTSLYATNTATATFKVRGTTVNIYTLVGNVTPTAGYTYSIDGGAPVAVADPGLGTATVVVQTITGLAAGQHTVTIAYNGNGTNRFQLVGVGAENDSGIVVDNFGRSGARSDYVIASGNKVTAWNGGTSNPADLVIYAMGLNDAQNSYTLETWTNNVATALNNIKLSNNGQMDLMLLLPHKGTFGAGTYYAQYAAQARGLAEAYGAALVNFWPMGNNSWDYWNSLGYWGNPTTVGAAGTDTVHPSDAGHKFMGDVLTPLLLN